MKKNRCKRAPKLACCQSSCATSKLVDAGPANAKDESDHADVNITHFNQKSSFSNLTHDSRWWLNLQPNNGFKKSVACEQLMALEEKAESFEVSDENKTCKGDAAHFRYENHDSSYNKNFQQFPELMDMIAKHEMMEIDSVGFSVSKQTKDFSLDSDYSWIEVENSQPWWRTTDRDELTCFVSHKSLNHIENCDLPPPKKYLRRQPYAYANISYDKIKTASFDLEDKSNAFSNLTVETKGGLDSGLMHRKLGLSSNNFASDKCSSYSTTIHEQLFEGDWSKNQLMEALCHSQTRAREAEELETLSTEIKNEDQPMSSLFPEALPWISFEELHKHKRKQKLVNAKQEMLGKPKSDISTHMVLHLL
ncbi:hypothetical protein SESBI_08240 [Sesbania bispinosa]|nr:hypothetical protein SESBI_08240 [Sesbania bispinosa]